MSSSRAIAIAAAYALEASTWLALNGHIPGDPDHDSKAWTAWRHALHAALLMAGNDPGPPGAATGQPPLLTIASPHQD